MQTSADGAAKWLDEQGKLMEAVLAELVEINSFTENVDGGRLAGARLSELFSAPGLTRHVHGSDRFADHLVFSTDGRKDASAIALVGHLDTVFPPGTFEGFRRDGDLARGPGVLDMKGGLVVVAYALKALAETIGLDALPPLRIVIVADEEVGSPEGKAIIESSLADADRCLVFEAGRAGDAIITRRKGTGSIKAKARGIAAHAGNHHADGANAIWVLARFIDRAQAMTDYSRGVTVNVGTIRGGESRNTVPDFAEAQLDLRFEAKADADALIERLRNVAREVSGMLPGTSLELEGGVARLPMERSDASVRLLDAYGAQARLVGLGGDEASLIGGGSDASTASAMGIASIDGLGPRGIGFHTKNEQIEIASLVLKAQALARFLAQAAARV